MTSDLSRTASPRRATFTIGSPLSTPASTPCGTPLGTPLGTPKQLSQEDDGGARGAAVTPCTPCGSPRKELFPEAASGGTGAVAEHSVSSVLSRVAATPYAVTCRHTVARWA